nr:hypothetical protein [Methanobacterium formicicum]
MKNIKRSFSPGITTQIAGIFTISMATLLSVMWLSIIIQSILSGVAPASLEDYTTLGIQALDLAVLAPAAIISGVLLLKRKPWGYTLMPIVMVKISLLGTAILSMIYFMMQKGVSVVWEQELFFLVATVGGIIITLAFYNKINSTHKKNLMDYPQYP